jgi:hypothetical protein
VALMASGFILYKYLKKWWFTIQLNLY